MLSARILLAPVSFMTMDSTRPPPKSISTPHSVCSWICFQLAEPPTHITTTAIMAMTESMFLMGSGSASSCCSGPTTSLPRMSSTAVAAKTTSVNIRRPSSGMSSMSTLNGTLKLGRSTTHSDSTMAGIISATTGMPYFSQSAKLMSIIVASSALGVLPTRVPIPPILALKAMPSSTKA